MAHSSACTLWCARKVLDTADIVREAIFRQLPTQSLPNRRSATGTQLLSQRRARFKRLCRLLVASVRNAVSMICTASSAPSMPFFLRTVLSLSAWLRQRHKQDCAAELHLVVDESLGVRLAGSVNRERQRLAIRRDFKFRVVHYLALHLVGNFERVCVYTLA